MSMENKITKSAVSDNPELHDLFLAYANFGAGNNKKDTMDGAKFYKLMKECGLIEGKLTKPDVDIIFQKVVKKERKLTFDGFLVCIDLIAKKKEQDAEPLKQKIVECGGPQRNNVTEFADDDWVKKQTDASLYTGIHKFRFDQEGKGRGLEGRTTQGEGQEGIKALLDRSPADIRGRRNNDVKLLEREDAHKKALAAKAQERLDNSAHIRER